MSVAVTLFCDCPIAQGDFPGVSEGNRSVGITIESIRNGVLSRVPSLSLYEFRLFFSLYSQNTQGGGGSTVRSSETEFTAPRKHRMLAIHKFSKMFPREQRERESEQGRD